MALLLAGITLLASGCNRGGSNTTVATPAPPVEQSAPPVSDEQCQQFAKKLEAAVKANRVHEVSKLLRFEDLVRRSISDTGLSPKMQQDIISGARSELQKCEPGAQICANVKTGGSYHFLRLLHDGNRPKALFRVISPDGGVNYLEFTIARFPDGDFGAEDIYFVATGEPISQTMRRFMIPGLSQLSGGLLSRLRGTDKQFVANAQLIQSMSQAIRDNRYADAQRAYRRMPKELQEDKAMLVGYIQAAANISDQEHAAAVETLRRLYPNDPCIDLMSVDYHLIRREYKLCLDDIDRLSRAIGGDAYLENLKVNVLIEMGLLKTAATAAETAIQMEPDLKEAYWSRVTVSLRARNHADTLVWLKKVAETFNLTLKDLRALPEYAEFVKTSQYRALMRWNLERKSKAKS